MGVVTVNGVPVLDDPSGDGGQLTTINNAIRGLANRAIPSSVTQQAFGQSLLGAATAAAARTLIGSNLTWVDVTCTATVLDASTGTGKVEVAAVVTAAQYKIRNIILVGGGTSFGGAGDRLLGLTDGTTVWTTIANADLETAPSASLAWGNAKVPFLTGTSNTASAAGAQIYFQYSGGTPGTPHTTGSISFSVLLEKVA